MSRTTPGETAEKETWQSGCRSKGRSNLRCDCLEDRAVASAPHRARACTIHFAKRAVPSNSPRREIVREGPVAPGEREWVRKKVNLGRKLAFFSGLAGDNLLLSLAGVMQVLPWSRWRTSVPEAIPKAGLAQSNWYSERCAEASLDLGQCGVLFLETVRPQRDGWRLQGGAVCVAQSLVLQ